MSDAYGPGGDKFFVFWAVSLPLSVLAVMIVYADTIRKAEVWVEVAAEHVGALSTSAGAEGVGASEKQSIRSLWQRITGRAGGKQDVEAQGPLEAASYGIQHKVELQIPAAPAAIPAVEDKADDPPSDQEEGEEEEAAPAQFPMLFTLGPGLYGVEEEEQPDVILEPSVGGRRAKAWQRKKLGWGGAMKTIVSHRKPRYCHEHSPKDLVAHEAHERKEREMERERGVRRLL
jgi:hypothetical protein